MNVIYLSSGCSNEKFAELRNKGITKKMPQAQKYHHLLMEGIAENIDGELVSISAIPVNRQWTKQVLFRREEEIVGKIRYIYDSFINSMFLRQYTRYIGALKNIKKLCSKNNDWVIICDVLNQSLANAARKAGKKYHIPVIGIVTDVPGHSAGARIKNQPFIIRKIAKLSSKMAQANLHKYNAYLLLTEEMNKVVNGKNRPYIVLEGQSDVNMSCRENKIENKTDPKIIMYAGGIHTEFGIKRMVNAFVSGGFEGWQLHIYGDGNYQNELKDLAEKNEQIKYFGIRPNSEIVENQLNASLLVNPRLTDAEYVKYSFPSKTMECMASGTPLLTTKLPGMPPEYYDFVYFFEEETEEGMLKAFRKVLSVPAEEMHSFGMKAKEFVLTEKNNICQAKKLVDFAAGLRVN